MITYMNASRITLIPLICILALGLAAGIDLTVTDINTATGVATVQGDTFALQPGSDSLYSGVWAHVWIPPGNDGVNAGVSERTVPSRTGTRTGTISGKEYALTNSYGDTTVVAKASKTGVLGSAEAFSEVSAMTEAAYSSANDDIDALGSAQIIAYISHSGTGTANASANGSSDYSSLIDISKIQSIGSVSGSAALDSANNYGGYVTGAAFKKSFSGVHTEEELIAESINIDYLSLESGRNSLSAKSIIDGKVSGESSSSGFCVQSVNPSQYGSSVSSLKGDLSATAATYKLGDHIRPSAITVPVYYYEGQPTQLDLQGAGMKGITDPLFDMFLFANEPKASAFMLTISEAFHYNPLSSNKDSWNQALTESFTSSGVTRTLADSNETYGASYINQGALSTQAYTSSASGKNPISLASAGVDNIFMGSGAHLISRLTGAQPASSASLVIYSECDADGHGYVGVNDLSLYSIPTPTVEAVGPIYSPSGTSADATGSYLKAANIDGTAVHIEGEDFTAPSKLIADDISEINIWSWIAGDDPRTHAESKYGSSPYVSTPAYTSDPIGTAGVTTGPTVTPGATATSRSVDVVFGSRIQY